MGGSKRKREQDKVQVCSDVLISAQGLKKVKRSKGGNATSDTGNAISHPLLSQLYPHVHSLRDHVLSRLPASSRLRRKKLSLVGLVDAASDKPVTETEKEVARLLDTTLVGCSSLSEVSQDDRWEKWNTFSQKGDESYVTLADGFVGASFSQTEIVDFATWLLFSREKKGDQRPKNLLCDGFRRLSDRRPHGKASAAQGQIPGLVSVYANNHARTLKQDPWPQLLLLLGKAGERMMIDLLLDCSIFTQVAAGRGNYQQLSGIPVSDLEYQHASTTDAAPARQPNNGAKQQSDIARSPSEITFVRSRMLYARAALNARGVVHFGLRHIHVLNRFPLKRESAEGVEASGLRKYEEATTRVMLYMFPRQFGLHNVFTSEVDHTQTAQKFQDYTLREEEITARFCTARDGTQQFKAHIPKRLRGLPQYLVERLQVLHDRCSYSKLLEHYCPAHGQVKRPTRASHATQKSTKSRKKSRATPQSVQLPQHSSLVELATPIAGVSAFCQAVLNKVIPHDFWGSGETQTGNRTVFLKKVDHFIRMRRFEQLSLHEVLQDLKITEIDWLTPPHLKGQKCSRPETHKRVEIFLEFLYYVVDSILIPLIRSNFYVTESNVHKYRLFFFRHDTWKYVAEPAMAALKTTMFEEVKLEDALKLLDSRSIGFSQVRLLPKGLKMRPIMNLRRRTLQKGSKKRLGPSINTILAPVGSMLKLEKTLNPDRLGSAMFSVGDIYKRIKGFKATLGAAADRPFYFAKVDVQGAFDSIPQQAVIDLMGGVPSEAEYKLVKHVEVKPSEIAQTKVTKSKPLKKWQTLARTANDRRSFKNLLESQLAQNKRNTVFVESVASRSFKTRALMALMTTHVQDNLVKIGKKYYRQKNGIPQGSVLSSTLCSYFYADLEQTQLSFLQAPDCLLLRLIDDFLLITTDRSKAARFVDVMHAGIPSYGVVVNPDKTLVNFDMSTTGGGSKSVARLPAGTALFPYCGTLIDTTTLAMAKNLKPTTTPNTGGGGAGGAVVFDSLTVEYGRYPGQNFRRKMLNAFKIQSHLMFFDTAHNSLPTVLSNIYSAFVETAGKTWAYARCLPRDKRPTPKLVVAAIRDLVDVAFLLLAGQSRARRYPGYKCEVRKSQVAWLAMVAFREVLRRKQAGYGEVIEWLERETRVLSVERRIALEVLMAAVKAS